MKTPRTTLKSIAIATMMAVTPNAALTAETPGKPNILFLFSDDHPKARITKLYHLAEDPQEMKDLAADPAMAARKRTLFAKLRKLQQDYDDKLDLAAVFPEFKIESK